MKDYHVTLHRKTDNSLVYGKFYTYNHSIYALQEFLYDITISLVVSELHLRSYYIKINAVKIGEIN